MLKHHGLQTIILPDTPPFRINGIIIPDKARKPTNTGTIVSIADGELKEGDKVAFNYRTGYEVEHEGIKYLSINTNYISAIKTENMIHPLGHRIVLRKINESKTVTEGGIVLIENKEYAEAEVIDVGEGTDTEPMSLIKGDKILYLKKSAAIVVDDLLIISQSEVIATTDESGVHPLQSRVLIDPIKKNETLSEGGVVLLEDKTIAEGKVLATGNGTSTEPMVLEVNDTVIYPKNAGIKVGDNIILAQSEVIAITNERAEVVND